MKHTRFAPGQEPKVLTSISEQCLDGKCERCPGIFEQDDYAAESIFCVHDCHKKRNQDAVRPLAGESLPARRTLDLLEINAPNLGR